MLTRSKSKYFIFVFLFIPLIISILYLSTNNKHVYHASPIQGLKIIKPRKSTHQKDWVYAAYDPAIAASFIEHNGGDFSFAKGSCNESGIFYIVERHKEAFSAYERASGSIYKLSSASFLSDQTDWSAEVVSTVEVPVIEEIQVDNVFEFLKKMEAEGRLKLYYYPDRPSCVPEDDSDIVEKAALWIEQGLPNTRERFLKLHPHLEIQLDEALKARK